MKKNNALKIILNIIISLLLCGSVAYYFFEIFALSISPTDNLVRMLAIVAACVGALIKLNTQHKRRTLDFYEGEYAEFLKGAFEKSPFYRKKLLCAIRLYNEDNLNKALKYLIDLKNHSETKEDVYSVGIFTGLVLTDLGRNQEAIFVYRAMIEMNVATSTVYSNLGSIYSGLGMYDDAIANLRLAVQNDENNPAAYNNLAKLYFDTYDLENAKKYAHLALEINHKFRPSATLLAIVYALLDDKENSDKYSHIAIASGEDPSRLQFAIHHYLENREKYTDKA